MSFTSSDAGSLDRQSTWARPFASSSEKAGNGTQREKLRKIERFFLRLTVFVFAAVIIYAIAASLLVCNCYNFAPNALLVIGLATIVSLSSCAFGVSIGFLFGIPRLQKSTAAVGKGPTSSTDVVKSDRARALNSNSNLEEISDWLTKIILGLGLVELKSLLSGLNDNRKYFSAVIGVDFQKVMIDEFFISLIAGSVIFGFLIGYIETRTRITSLLYSTEEELDGAADDLDSLEQATQISPFMQNGSPFSLVAPKVDNLLLSLDKNQKSGSDNALRAKPFDAVTSVAEMARKALAHAATNELETAEDAWKRVLRDPQGASLIETYFRLAEVRAAQGRARDAFATLAEARRRFPPNYQLLRQMLFLALYLPPADGFTTAIKLIDEISTTDKLQTAAASDPMFYLWSAAAYGQQARWLIKSELKPMDDANIVTLRDKIIAALQNLRTLCPRVDDPPRVWLRQMLFPGTESGDPIDNDLEIFAEDPKIRDLAMNA